MFNAKLVVKRSPDGIEPVAYPKLQIDIEHNYDVMLPVMKKAMKCGQFRVTRKSIEYSAYYGIVGHGELFSALVRMRWCVSGYFAADLRYLEELKESVKDWVVVMPQVQSEAELPELGGVRGYMRRKRSRPPLFQAISDPKHRGAAERIAGLQDYDDPLAESLRAVGRGAVILYPMVEASAEPVGNELAKGRCILAFRMVPPAEEGGARRPLVEFEARNSAFRSLAIVPRTSDK